MEKVWSASSLLELSGSYWATCALHAGVMLDLFTALGEEKKTASEVAARLGTDPRATGMLLAALAAMGLLERNEEHYANGEAALTFLVRDSERYLGHIIRHHHHLMEGWARLDEAVRSGRPLNRPVHGDEERRESFLMGMYNLASLLAPVLVAQIDLEGRQRLLDLGGGPGTYAIHFCLRNPDLSAVVFDLPATRPFAEKTIARYGLSDRISFVEGDFLHSDTGGRYDVAWLSHILHSEAPDDCERLLKRAVASLKPGGLLLVHEFILDDDHPGPVFPALFSLNMLLGTEGGQSYSQRQIAAMMEKAGLREIRRLDLQLPGPTGVMAGGV